MPDTTTRHPDLERLARRRVKARIGWLIHATVYVSVMAFLTVLGALQGDTWPVYPALGWGLGLFMHGMAVFVAGSAWREQWVEREHQRLVRERTRVSS